MTRLTELHQRLARLRRRRQWVRTNTGLTAVVLAVLWILAVAFAADWLFEMNQLQRFLSLLVCAGVVVWAFRRFALPWLGGRETELDMALLVEREERIDTDLVAAVQFEWPDAPAWGSVQLEQAVIEQVADRGKRINVMRGLSRRELHRRTLLLALTVVVWAVVALLAPGHVTTFLSRFVLGSRHYPTRTVIEKILINGEDPTAAENNSIYVLYGRPVQFEVTCKEDGELPESGRADLAARRSGLKTSLALKPDPERKNVYLGELPRLVETVEYQLFLGDAWTDSANLVVAALPVVAVELEVEPPAYAKKDSTPTPMPTGLRQISVIEGSRVIVKVHADKQLEEATLSIEEQPYELTRKESGGPGDLWVLDADDSPLHCVTKPIRYSIQVTDRQRQQLERPIEGVIRIQADALPRVTAGIITQYVLPTARPTVYFGATDDYGLARVVIVREVIGAGGESRVDEVVVYPLPTDKPPQRRLERGSPLDLGPMDLVKGDQVQITVRAVDFRGPQPGKSAEAEPLIFQVTDEQGILASMMEADIQSARQLKTMIQRQLGIGESP